MSASLCIAVFLGLALGTSSSPTESRQCRPGFFYNSTTDLCQGCPSGTYTNNHNLNSHCDRCTTCTGLHKLASSCTASSDAVCRCPDGYYEHDDGCSPKAGANTEARLPDTPEWTWSEYFVIILTVLVLGIIGFAIFVLVRFPELRTKLLCCQRISSPELSHQPPNGGSAPPVRGAASVGSAVNVPDSTTQPQGNGDLAAANASGIAHHPTSVPSVPTGAVDSGTHGEPAVPSTQPEVRSESKFAITPEKGNRLARIEDVDLHKMVELPPKASSDGLEMPGGNKVAPPAAPADGTTEGRASAAGQQVNAPYAEIPREVDLHQGHTQKTVHKAPGPLHKVYEPGTLLSQATEAGTSTPDGSEAIAEDIRDTDPLISRVTADVGSTDAHRSPDKDVRRTSALQIAD